MFRHACDTRIAFAMCGSIRRTNFHYVPTLGYLFARALSVSNVFIINRIGVGNRTTKIANVNCDKSIFPKCRKSVIPHQEKTHLFERWFTIYLGKPIFLKVDAIILYNLVLRRGQEGSWKNPTGCWE